MIPEHLTEDAVQLRHRERVEAELVSAGFGPTETERLWELPEAMERLSKALHSDWNLHVDARSGELGRRQRREERQKRKETANGGDGADADSDSDSESD